MLIVSIKTDVRLKSKSPELAENLPAKYISTLFHVVTIIFALQANCHGVFGLNPVERLGLRQHYFWNGPHFLC